MKKIGIYLFIVVVLIQKNLCNNYGVIETILKAYFYGIDNSAFVVIGTNSMLTFSLQSELKNWKGIFISDNIDFVNKRLFSKTNHQFLYLMLAYQPELQKTSISREQFKSSYLSLAQVCRNYYLVQPQLLVITDGSNQQQILALNNWQNQKCLPSVIIVMNSNTKDQIQVKNYLITHNYHEQKILEKIRIYIKSKDLQKIEKRVVRNDWLTEMNKTPKMSQFIISIYLNLFNISLSLQKNQTEIQNPKLIQIKSMSYSQYILQDLIDQTKFALSNKPIFIFNFQPKQDKIIMSHNNFTMNDIQTSEMWFKKIELQNLQSSISIYFNLKQKNQFINLIYLNQKKIFDGQNCPFKTEDDITVIIRNSTYYNPVLPVRILKNPKDPRFNKTDSTPQNIKIQGRGNFIFFYLIVIILFVFIAILAYKFKNFIMKNRMISKKLSKIQSSKEKKLAVDEIFQENQQKQQSNNLVIIQ